MTNKEKAQGLWAVVMDRLRPNAEHRAALDELLALKKSAKTSLDKLGVPQVMWDREDKKNLENAKLIAATDPLDEKPKPSAMPAITAGLRAILGGASASQGAAVAAAKAPTPTIKEAMLKAQAHLEGEEASDLKPLITNEVVEIVKKGGDVPPALAASIVERGLISAEVRRRLTDTDETYSEIAEAVRGMYPSARTTSRSIASVASDLRRAGQAVAIRRVPAKAAAK